MVNLRECTIFVKNIDMKKIILLSIAAIAMAFSSADTGDFGCNGFMPVQKGITIEYKDYNAKDKLTGSQITTVKDLRESGGILTVTLHAIIKDDKDKVVSEDDFIFTCQNGEIKIDMQAMMNNQMANGMEDMEVTISQTNLIYPGTLSAGQTLPDAQMTMTVSSSGMQVMKMVTDIVNRKVEKEETITTEAGAFPCYKLTQTIKSDMGMMKMEMTSAEWMSAGVGVVRSEQYNKKGELESYRLLTKITR